MVRIVLVIVSILLTQGVVQAQDNADKTFLQLNKALEEGLDSDELELIITPSVVTILSSRQRNQLYEVHHRTESYTAPTPWYVPVPAAFGGLMIVAPVFGPSRDTDPAPFLIAGGALVATSLALYVAHVSATKRERLEYNKSLARLLGLSGSTSLLIAPTVLPTSTGGLAPGIGVSVGL